MISAMPAVAVRRERKKTRSFRSSGPPSHHSSVTSLSRGRSFTHQKRPVTQSISTISGPEVYVRQREVCEAQRQKRRFLIYLGTVLMIAGLILVFIGVGANVAHAQTVGLLFIGIGCLLCLIKVFFSQSQDVVKKTLVQADIGDSIENIAVSSVASPASNGAEFTPLPVQMSPTQDSNSNQNSSLTPTSLNSIPETQVLITEEGEKF